MAIWNAAEPNSKLWYLAVATIALWPASDGARLSSLRPSPLPSGLGSLS